MATLENILGIYEVQKRILPILEKDVIDKVLCLDLSLSGIKAAPWNKNILMTTAVRDNLAWNNEVKILTPDVVWDLNRAKEKGSNSLRGFCYILRLMLHHSTE